MISLPIILEVKLQEFYEGKGTQKALKLAFNKKGYIITFHTNGAFGVDCEIRKKLDKKGGIRI